MGTITRTYTFSDGTAAYGSQVESEIGNIVDTWNAHNTGSSTWTAVKVSSTAANPVDITSSSTSGTELSVNNTATDGDPIISLELSGTQKAAFWVDDSDSDTIKIGRSTSNEDLKIDGTNGNVIIRGTPSSDSAATGYVGEYVESLQTSATNLPTTGQYGNDISISLTAGDWDISAVVDATANGATVTRVAGGIGTATGNASTGTVQGSNFIDGPIPVNGVRNGGLSIPSWRVSIASTTTYYLKVYAEYSAATPQYRGRISARRVR